MADHAQGRQKPPSSWAMPDKKAARLRFIRDGCRPAACRPGNPVMYLFLRFLKVLYKGACRYSRNYALANYALVEICGLKVWTPDRYHLLISTTLKAIQDHNPELFSLITDHISFIYSSPANLDLGFVDKAIILNNGYIENNDAFWENSDRVWCQLGGCLAVRALLSREVSAGRLRVLFRGSKVKREAVQYGREVTSWLFEAYPY